MPDQGKMLWAVYSHLQRIRIGEFTYRCNLVLTVLCARRVWGIDHLQDHSLLCSRMGAQVPCGSWSRLTSVRPAALSFLLVCNAHSPPMPTLSSGELSCRGVRRPPLGLRLRRTPDERLPFDSRHLHNTIHRGDKKQCYLEPPGRRNSP